MYGTVMIMVVSRLSNVCPHIEYKRPVGLIAPPFINFLVKIMTKSEIMSN